VADLGLCPEYAFSGGHIIFHKFFADPEVGLYVKKGIRVDVRRFFRLEVLVIGLADVADEIPAIDIDIRLAGINDLTVDSLIILEIRIEDRQRNLHFGILEIVGQKLDRLVGYLGKFVRAGELVKGRIHTVQQIADGDALAAAAICQGILRAKACLGIELCPGSFEIQQ
jgi:hypothetical protein